MLSIGSLFSGIGGLELGLEWAGLGPVLWQVEKDPFCRDVLARHWPDAEKFEDVRTFTAPTTPDLICGGFPCQDISSAGKGAGLAGERSGLWFEFARILKETRPRWVVVENVASGARRWVDPVRFHLGRLGYESLPVPLSAEDVGAPYPRARVFIVAHLDSDGKPSESLNAKMGGTSSVRQMASRERQAANSDGIKLREQSRRSERSKGEGSQILERHCGWSTLPEVDAVVSGLPGRVDHQRALGNAVVPQCAEVIGWVVRELCGHSACGAEGHDHITEK